jgi:hypothetical protein
LKNEKLKKYKLNLEKKILKDKIKKKNQENDKKKTKIKKISYLI